MDGTVLLCCKCGWIKEIESDLLDFDNNTLRIYYQQHLVETTLQNKTYYGFQII